MRSDDNKRELFRFLAELLIEEEIVGKQIVTTVEEEAICTPPKCLDLLSPCKHEEADTRMILHANDAANTCKTILIRTVDTDVVVIATANFSQLNVDTLWIGFGVGKHFRYIAIHELANTLGPAKSKALPLFHALTGCDTVSAFCGRGKKTGYDTWSVVPNLTDAILRIIDNPDTISDFSMNIIERFVILLYDLTSSKTSVNACRKELFASKGRTMENLPPTKDALTQHIKRAVHQAVHIWNQAISRTPIEYNYSDWGWELMNNENWANNI